MGWGRFQRILRCRVRAAAMASAQLQTHDYLRFDFLIRVIHPAGPSVDAQMNQGPNRKTPVRAATKRTADRSMVLLR